MNAAIMPLTLSDIAWQHATVRQALRGRDIGALFRFVQHHSGASQARIGTATGMNQGRVNEVMNGRRQISRLDVFERIADGLTMPDDARRILGLAPQREPQSGGRAFDLAAFPEVVRVFSDQASAAAEIQRQARPAKEVDVLAVRGLGLLGLRDSLLRPAVSRDGDPPCVRVLLLHPDSPATAQRAAEIGESTESLAGGIRLAEARLRELVGEGNVQVFRYRVLPTWRIIRLDTTLYVSAFDTEWQGHESATYKVLATPHGPLFRGFRRMFDAMVEEGERVV